MNKKIKTSFVILLIFMIAGLMAYIIQFAKGFIVTDMNNLFSWGLYIGGFAFFVGNAAGGMVLSASVYLFGLTHLKPFAKLGAITAFANVVVAMISVMVDIGQPLRFMNLILHMNFTSPIAWDIIILNSYAVLTLIYLYILLLPDLQKGPFRRIALQVENPEEFSHKWAKRLSPVAMFFAVGIHVVTSWIFSTQGSREWWHTAVLSPDFVAVAVSAGTAVVLLFSVFLYGNSEEHIESYRTMTKIITGAFILHLFLMYNDFFIKSWYNSESETHAIGITLFQYTGLHLGEVLLPLFGVLIIAKTVKAKTRSGVYFGTSIVLLGVLFHRLLLFPAAYNAIPLTLKPLGVQDSLWSYPVSLGRQTGQDITFATTWNYVPSVYEILIFMSLVAFMSFVVLSGYQILLKKGK